MKHTLEVSSPSGMFNGTETAKFDPTKNNYSAMFVPTQMGEHTVQVLAKFAGEEDQPLGTSHITFAVEGCEAGLWFEMGIKECIPCPEQQYSLAGATLCYACATGANCADQRFNGVEPLYWASRAFDLNSAEGSEEVSYTGAPSPSPQTPQGHSTRMVTLGVIAGPVCSLRCNSRH